MCCLWKSTTAFCSPPICAFDAENLYQLLETVILPLYYDRPAEWMAILKASVREVQPTFDSDRMAAEYMEKLYMIGPV
ncbi:hypothetical protein [Spirosoma sp. 209]|uniref:hypothetical protein n=1 Tax=Spirosoma sp. 209 TaxID=1955701 RepID=UPI001115D80A|nr:hypothetical protein [Spirosoma sp. 209]